MDLWESCLIYAPVSGPGRSARAPGEVKSRTGTGAAAVPPTTSPPRRHPAAAQVGLGLGGFSLPFKPNSGNLGVFLLCPFLPAFSKARLLGHRSQSVAVAMPGWGLAF